MKQNNITIDEFTISSKSMYYVIKLFFDFLLLIFLTSI